MNVFICTLFKSIFYKSAARALFIVLQYYNITYRDWTRTTPWNITRPGVWLIGPSARRFGLRPSRPATRRRAVNGLRFRRACIQDGRRPARRARRNGPVGSTRADRCRDPSRSVYGNGPVRRARRRATRTRFVGSPTSHRFYFYFSKRSIQGDRRN